MHCITEPVKAACRTGDITISEIAIIQVRGGVPPDMRSGRIQALVCG
ncbi:uncharacterized protein METZ01_LOCUS234845, partial [marine metagenome]